MEDGNGITYVGLNELTSWLGLTSRRVIQMVEEGIIIKEGRGKYPLKVCITSYIEHLKRQAEGTGRRSELGEEKLLTARIERKRRELEYAEHEGSLVTVESHRAAMAEAFDLVRSNIRNLPGSVAPRLVGIDDPRDIQQILAPAVDDALRAIVRDAKKRIADEGLPEDLPARKQLEAAGIKDLADLLEVPSLTNLQGIGPKRASQIRAWMEDRR
jgi:phage terminase Nu1 subunit (DNA packaging protein)